MSVSGSVSRGKYRQIFIRKRRDDEEEEEDNGDSVDATLTGKEGLPRLGEGMRELMGEKDLKEEMKGVKRTIDAMHQMESTNEITRREMREGIFNRQREVAQMKSKMKDQIDASLQYNLTRSWNV